MYVQSYSSMIEELKKKPLPRRNAEVGERSTPHNTNVTRSFQHCRAAHTALKRAHRIVGNDDRVRGTGAEEDIGISEQFTPAWKRLKVASKRARKYQELHADLLSIAQDVLNKIHNSDSNAAGGYSQVTKLTRRDI